MLRWRGMLKVVNLFFWGVYFSNIFFFRGFRIVDISCCDIMEDGEFIELFVFLFYK